ncbi:MAG: helix-turn-helix domain-containing protein [Anaerocolumna sp.]
MNALKQGELLFDKQISILDLKAMEFTNDNNLKWILKMDRQEFGGTNAYTIAKFQKQLNEKLSDSATFCNYSLILKNEFIFNSNTVVFGLDFYYQHWRNYSNMTAKEWEKQSFDENSRNMLPMQNVQINGIPIMAMTYNYPIINMTSKLAKTDGVIQFLISYDTIRDWFLPLLSGSEGKIYIFDKQGNCLAALNHQDSAEIPSFAKMTDDQGNFQSVSENESQIIVYKHSSDNDFVFAAVLPEQVVMSDARQIRRMSVSMILICLFIEIMLGIYFAWKYTTPIRNLVQNIQRIFSADTLDGKKSLQEEAKAEDMKTTVNEYEYLKSSISHLIQTNQKMESTLRERKIRERINFLNCLFDGQFRYDEEVCREAALAGFPFGNQQYCVVSFLTGERSEQIMKELNEKEFVNVLAIHVTDNKFIHVLSGIPKSEKDTGCIAAIVHEIMEMILEKYGQQLNIGIGTTYENETNITYSYMQSCYCACVTSDRRKDGILKYSEVSEDINALYYPTELEIKLINSTKYSEIKQIEEIFKCLHNENIEKRHLSQTMQRVLVSNMAATLFKIYNDLVMDAQVNQMIEMVCHYQELPQALLVLKEQFIQVSYRLQCSRDEREETYHRQLKEYIELNYINSQLCVSMAAENFALSEGYFSQFFKEVTGEAFSSYLERIRLTKAKELIGSGKYDIELVASMTGYNNSGTFRRAFKRVNGISPSAWKQNDTM